MKNRKNIGFFALMAIVAMAIYALSCRPSWNPEGTKFAYVYYEKEKQGIAIYDTQNDKNDFLFEKNGDSEKDLLLDVFWMKNGRDLLYVTQFRNDDKSTTFSITKYNINTKEERIISQFELPIKEAAIGAPVFFENEKYLWISDIKDKTFSIAFRVNVNNGKYKVFGDEENPWRIIGNKNRIFFMKASTENEGEYIYGKISRFPWFKEKELFRLKFESDTIFQPLMIKPEKKDIFAYMTIVDEKFKVALLDTRGKQIKIIELKDIDDEGNTDAEIAFYYCCEWDNKGKRLWLLGGKDKHAGLFDVDIEKGTSKFIPIPGKKKIPWHLSFSPKEDMLAFSMGNDDADNYKYGLLDLRADEPKVKIIYPPNYEPEKEESEEE